VDSCINNSPTSPTLNLYYFLLVAAIELINEVLAAENTPENWKKKQSDKRVET
jgi:hypothetical protein